MGVFMIVLCPQAFAGSSELQERDFLMYYLSRTNQKAFIANEVWETFRLRILKQASSKEIAKNIIAHFRGVFNPEELKLDSLFNEIEPKKDYSPEELVEKTKDFVKRKWADIDLFITQEPEKYEGLIKVKILRLEEFFVEQMGNETSRNWITDFSYKTATEKNQ